MTKKILSIILAAILLVSVCFVLPLTAQATTITRIDEFRFAANPNAITINDRNTVGVWLNNLKNANNGIGKGVMAAADTEGWEVQSIVGVHDFTDGRYLEKSEYPNLNHSLWLRIKVRVTDPDRFAFNSNGSYSFPTYVNGIKSGGCPLDAYNNIDIYLLDYTVIPSVAFTVPEPKFGDSCSSYVPSIAEMPFNLASQIQITNYEWGTLSSSGWFTECTSFSDRSANYCLNIEFTTKEGYSFPLNSGTVTVNGKQQAYSQYYSDVILTTKTSYSVSFDDDGSTVSGSFTSYLNTAGITIELLQDGAQKYSASYQDDIGSYSLNNVAAGSYILRVSKTNHVTRDYPITVSGNTKQDVQINPIGDVDGNGKVQANDAMKAYQHAQGKADAQLSGYAFLCADVAPAGNPNDKVQAADAMVIYQQAQGKHSLF